MMIPLPPQILVVDDDKRIRELLGRFLREQEFEVVIAKDAEEALLLWERFQFDLVLLDVLLPGHSGKELAARLRQHSSIPILMLTALGEVEDRVTGLESGADDYLVKPFEPRELILRIKKLLQRARVSEVPSLPSQAPSVIPLGGCVFEMATSRLWRGKEIIPLTRGELNLLTILTTHLGQPLTRQELAEQCGGINERSIDVQVIRLRNKIENDPKKPLMLQTVRGEGYVLYPLHHPLEETP